MIRVRSAGINLEDIAAPRCFEIERKLKERLRHLRYSMTISMERRCAAARR